MVIDRTSFPDHFVVKPTNHHLRIEVVFMVPKIYRYHFLHLFILTEHIGDEIRFRTITYHIGDPFG